MTRVQLLQLLVQQARESGFTFRKWFTASAGITWTTADDAITWLSRGERASLLLFSHGFARHFWRSGERVTFLVPSQTFQRVTPQGSTRTIERKAHMRRSSREDVWRFHLREMAAAAEPLRYIRRYLTVQEIVQEIAAAGEGSPEGQIVDSYDDEGLVRETEAPKPGKKGVR